jgi:Tol biopolymer transport system component
MPLAAGQRVGPYEILGPLGAGGMGEVYRARDTRLDRTVAIKVLPAHLSSNPEMRARFDREARAISALNHPHICTLHDVGHEGEVDFLVLEHLEGETLAERLARGPLPLAEALARGIEILDALDKAHRQGIAHRDLKPGNVFLTRNGAKLLDFGLAKGIVPAGSSTSGPASATLPSPITEKGTVVGTFQYMAPEQLEGKEADARSDIFAFGATLYEMLTAKRAFEGTSQASLIASILKDEPRPIREFVPVSPPQLDRILRRCLAKDPEDRWQSAADLGEALRWIVESQGGAGDAAAGAMARGNPALRWVPWGVAAIAVAAAAALTLLPHRASTVIPGPVTATLLPPEGVMPVATSQGAGPVVISPDGAMIAFVGRHGEEPQQLWVRAMNEDKTVPLPGTQGATRPFWSPDSRMIGFGAGGKLRKISALGGPVTDICECTDLRGGTWNPDGVIIFTPDSSSPLFRVADSGGDPVQITTLDTLRNESTHRYPWFLPDGNHFLFLDRQAGAGSGEEPLIMAASLDDPRHPKRIASVASNASYAAGHLLYVQQQSLIAQPFDPVRLQTTGEPQPIVGNVRMDERFSRGVFSASQNGILVYQTGKDSPMGRLHWVARDGTPLGDVGDPAPYAFAPPEISPDGSLALIGIQDMDSGVYHLWTVDLVRGTRTRLSLGENDILGATWSPDSKHIAFWDTGGPLWLGSLSGTLDEQLYPATNKDSFPVSWSRDGQFLLVALGDKHSLTAISMPGGERRIAITTKGLDPVAAFSPDHRWIAYDTDESGRREVYVTGFDGVAGKWQISTEGGAEPRWRADGKELYYFNASNRLVAVSVDTEGGTFRVLGSETLFQARPLGAGAWRYDAGRDGKRFLLQTPVDDPALAPMTAVVNWPGLLAEKN